jgi:excisionase family DNA binding protein
MNESLDEYISKTEMAKRMDVTTRTIETWMRERKVPFEKIGKTLRFHWGDVRQHLSRQSRVAAQPRDHLRPVEGTSARLRELAASIRQRQRLTAKAPTKLGIHVDNSGSPASCTDSVQSGNASR